MTVYFEVPSDIHAGVQGVVVGLGAGAGFWILLAGLRERRRFITDESDLQSVFRLIAGNQHNLSDGRAAFQRFERGPRVDERIRSVGK